MQCYENLRSIFNLDNVELSIDDEALKAIAKKAIQRKTGARGLRNIMEEILMELMYAVPSDESITKVVITSDVVDGEGSPKVVRRKTQAKQLKETV